jgi:pyruvate ferredoxin oxidoreductase delta subunit
MVKEKIKKEKFITTASGIEITPGAVMLNPGSTKNYKTGEWRTFKPEIDQSKCIKCAKCWMSCPDAAVYKDKEGKFNVNYDYCKGCLICAKECPVKAISYKVEEK